MSIKYKTFILLGVLILVSCSLEPESPILTSTIEPEPTANTSASPMPTITPTATVLEYPPARGFTQLQFHPPSGKMIMFGGESNQRVSYSDTWEYDPAINVWAERFPDVHPEGIGGTSSTYDAESDKFIFYFSTILDRSVSSGLIGISETWAYDFTTNTWENMNPTSHPEKIMGARMAYDIESDRIILFGGADFTASETTTFTETWAYDYNTNTWEKMNPAQTPIGRSYFGMAYAANQDQIYVFGGRVQASDKDRQNELWAYDYNSDTWNKVNYSGQPNPDHHAIMVYNPIAGQLWYLVGTDLMTFDLETSSWDTINSSPSRSPIYFHAMAVDAEGDLIVFGGGPQGLTYNNKSFVYSLSNQAWTSIGP